MKLFLMGTFFTFSSIFVLKIFIIFLGGYYDEHICYGNILDFLMRIFLTQKVLTSETLGCLLQSNHHYDNDNNNNDHHDADNDDDNDDGDGDDETDDQNPQRLSGFRFGQPCFRLCL